MNTLGVDMLSASAHKFNGPKGIGFLYVRTGTNIVPYLSGGAQEDGKRAEMENAAAIVGMAHALKANVGTIAENARHLALLETELLKALRDDKMGFIRNGSDNRIPGNISLSFPDSDGEALLHRLDLMGICVSTGSACDSRNTQISHVLKAIGLDEKYAKGTIRISLGKNNTVEDVKTIAEALSKILHQ